jgi:hypothetical protein
MNTISSPSAQSVPSGCLSCNQTLLSRLLLLILGLALPGLPTAGLSADGANLWGSDGIKLDEEVSPHSVWNGGVVSDGDGGAIAVWVQALDLTPSTYSAMLRAQRINASGNKVWAGGGIGYYVSSRATCHDPAVAPDGAGGLLVAWWTGQSFVDGIYAQRLNASGTPLWGSSDVKVGVWLGNTGGPRIVPDNIGGAFVGWAHRLTHLQPSGALDAPGLEGIEIIPGTEQNTYKMVSDGTGGSLPTPVPGGIFAVWSTAGGQLVAQRVKAGLQWGPSGMVVATHGGIVGYDLARDGSGGLLLCWVATDGAHPYRYTVRAQRLDVNGNKLWAPAGVIVLDSDVVAGSYSAPYYSAPAVTADGAGGAIATWLDNRNWGVVSPLGLTNYYSDLYAQRVDAGGARAWTPSGVLLPPYILGQGALGGQGEPRIVSDTRYGAMVVYDDNGGWNWDIAGTRLNANGLKYWSQWIRWDGSSPSNPGLPQRSVQTAFDASGALPKGAVLVWDESEGGHHRVYAQKVELDLNTSPTLANDACTGAIPLTENVYYVQSTANATDDGYSPCLGRTRTKGVWFTYTPTQTGTATVDTCPSDFDNNLEVFVGGCGGLTSIGCNEDSFSCPNYWQASFSFACVAGTTYLIYAGGYNGQSGNLQIRARTSQTLANDFCSGAIALTENVYHVQSTASATDDGDSACLGRPRTKGVWFTFTPRANGKATVDTCPSDFDTNLEVFTGGCGALTSVGCNEDSWGCSAYWQAFHTFPCAAGTTYLIYAGGYNGQSGNLQIRVRMPVLYWHRHPSHVLNLSWVTGYILQSASSLTPERWTDVSEGVNTNGPTCSFSASMSDSTRYFRLR